MAKPKTTEFDVDKWIEEHIGDVKGVSEQERAIVRKILDNEEVQQKVRASTLRQSDYSRRQDELAAERKRLEEEHEARQAKLQEKYQELTQWQGEAKKQIEEISEQLDMTAAEKAQLERAVNAAKEDGFDLDEYLRKNPPASVMPTNTNKPERKTKEPSPDYVSKDDFQKQMRRALELSTSWPFELLKIQNEHQAIFGKSMSANEIDQLKDAYFKNPKVGVDEHWFDMFKVSDKLTERQNEDLEKRLAEAREEGRREAREAYERPPDAPPDPDSFYSPAHKLTAKIRQERFGEGDRMAGLSPVDKAAAAWREGRYAPPGSPRHKPAA